MADLALLSLARVTAFLQLCMQLTDEPLSAAEHPQKAAVMLKGCCSAGRSHLASSVPSCAQATAVKAMLNNSTASWAQGWGLAQRCHAASLVWLAAEGCLSLFVLSLQPAMSAFHWPEPCSMGIVWLMLLTLRLCREQLLLG